MANLRYNLNEVVVSLGCTVELQVNNTRAAWRVSTAPLRAVFKDLLVRTPRVGRAGPLCPGGPAWLPSNIAGRALGTRQWGKPLPPVMGPAPPISKHLGR